MTCLVGAANVAVETRTYDDESRVIRRAMTRGATVLVADTLHHDTRSKLLAATGLVPNTGAVHQGFVYAAAGPLVADNFGGAASHTYVTDVLGNARTTVSTRGGSKTSTSYYQAGTTILDHVVTGHAPLADTATFSYTAAGATRTTTTLTELGIDPLLQLPMYARRTTEARYSADEHLMVTYTHLDTAESVGIRGPQTYTEREEYRYDALGRRVWRRLVRPDQLCPLMNKASGCLSVVERTIWDGDQVVAESRADGGATATSAQMDCDGPACLMLRPNLEGIVVYTHGAGLDHPLSVIARGEAIVPVYNWRDRPIDCVVPGGLCDQLTWSARTEQPFFDDPAPTDPNYTGDSAWAGSALGSGKDGSGLIYKRNRYYDPTTGRFTQVDPIGLGGGLNAYGFAGGDPVNYTDPFGLTKCNVSQSICDALDKLLQVASFLTLGKGAENVGHTLSAGQRIPLARGVQAETLTPTRLQITRGANGSPGIVVAVKGEVLLNGASSAMGLPGIVPDPNVRAAAVNPETGEFRAQGEAGLEFNVQGNLREGNINLDLKIPFTTLHFHFQLPGPATTPAPAS